MEGAMDHPLKKHDLDFDYDAYRLDRDHEFGPNPDTAGYWFMAAVVFAFIAAGIIVYRASNNVGIEAYYPDRAVAQSDPVTGPSIFPR
jgi:hypothetical protein